MHGLSSSRPKSTASIIRSRIEQKGEGYWRVSDFNEFPPLAVAQTLSRLSREKALQRIGKGIYYHSRKTAFGNSQPATSDIVRERLRSNVLPAGYTAANLLGFTTQNPARQEYATSANAIAPQTIKESRIKILTRRPESWKQLAPTDAAILDFIRRRGETSELSNEGTRDHLLELLGDSNRFARLIKVAMTEPPRVRAILGAIGHELDVDAKYLRLLKGSLNPLSRFDFGVLSALLFAREWQAR